MKCDEVQPLHGPYLDSELDARTTLEIQEHLKACPDCTRLFAAEEKLEAQIRAGLNQGPRTAALWEQIERAVVTGAQSGSRPRPRACDSQPAAWQAFWSALGAQFPAGFRRSPKAWCGLAALWVMILTLNFAAHETDTPLVAGKQLPPAAEVRFAVKQQRLLMAELASLAEPALADKVKTVPPSPHSERRNETLNT